MLVSKIKEEHLTIDLIDKLLFQGLDDTGEPADCIVVLGSMKAATYRVPVAIAAYRAGRADKILLCGGKIRDFPTGRCTEAEHMRCAALDLGVRDEDIILENSSRNTVENILYTLIELQRSFWLNQVHRVLLVTTAYHMRRCLAIARYLFPAHIEIVPCPADDTNTKRDNWMKTPAGRERAKSEAMKIVGYVVEGMIPDFEI